MTRQEKIKKLANAVKEYRGSYHDHIDKEGNLRREWIRTSKPSAYPRIRKWLIALEIDPVNALDVVDSFTSLKEFHDWLKSLELEVKV